MNGEAILEVLGQIRDESRETNVRLESLEGRVEETNTRLRSLEGRFEELNGRVEFFERRTTQALAHLSDGLDASLKQQIESEMRLSSEVISLANVTREVRDFLVRKLDDHAMVRNHEERTRSLENRIADRSSE